MKIVISELAAGEIEDGSELYEQVVDGYGNRFRAEVRKALLRIAEHPQAWVVEKGDVRKCVMHTFPHKILYSIEEDHIFVIAVAHMHRRPEYWIDEYMK